VETCIYCSIFPLFAKIALLQVAHVIPSAGNSERSTIATFVAASCVRVPRCRREELPRESDAVFRWMILECVRSHARDEQYETVLMSGIREIVIKNKNTRWFFIAVRFVLYYEIARIPLLQYFCVSLRDTKRLFIPLQRGVQRFITKAIHCSPSLCSSEW